MREGADDQAENPAPSRSVRVVDFQDLLIQFVHLIHQGADAAPLRRKRRFADCMDFADEDEDGELISDPSLSVSSALSVPSAAHETDHIASLVLDPELPSMMSTSAPTSWQLQSQSIRV